MTDKIYTDHYENKTDLEWDCPEHYMPQDKPIAPKQYKVTTLLHKQNEPIVKEETQNQPIGIILMFHGDIVPTDYFRCDGSELCRDKYEALFDLIGTLYGGGDKTFNLPDFREEHQPNYYIIKSQER